MGLQVSTPPMLNLMNEGWGPAKASEEPHMFTKEH